MNRYDNYKQTIYKMVEQWTAKACNGSKSEVKKYILKRRDDELVYFNYDLSWVHIVKAKTELLPLPLKRLIKPGYMEEFVDKEDDIGYELNEDGIYLFELWLQDRAVPSHRNNYKKYLPEGCSAKEWLFENKGYSLNDCYWIASYEDKQIWSQLQVRRQTAERMSCKRAEKLEKYAGINATLGGQLEKGWSHEGKMLWKVGRGKDDILIVREGIANIVYNSIGYKDFCSYALGVNEEEKIEECYAECFTNGDVELVTAYDLLEEYNMTQIDDVWDMIIELAADCGLDKQVTRDYLDIQTLVDYLITNRDRHQNNIAFLRDVETLQIIKPAPIFDSGSTAQLEYEPVSLLDTKVNGLYATERELLMHVKKFDVFDAMLLPSGEEIRAELEYCKSLSEARKVLLTEMYEQKKKFLVLLQEAYRQGKDMKDFLQKYGGTE